jgi:hypothetical protein
MPSPSCFQARVFCPPTHLPFLSMHQRVLVWSRFSSSRLSLPSSRNSRLTFSRSEGLAFSRHSACSQLLIDSEHHAQKTLPDRIYGRGLASQTFPTDYEGIAFVVQTHTLLDIVFTNVPSDIIFTNIPLTSSSPTITDTLPALSRASAP